MKFISRATALVAGSLLFMGAAQSATLQLDLGHSFGDTSDPDWAPPDGAGPWLTAFFDDGGSAGSATLTLSVADIGGADITSVYLNFNDALGIDNLSIAYAGGSGPTPTSILQSMNTYQADGDGIYDLKIDWANNDFMASEVIVFNITGSGAASGFVASDFNYISEVGDEKGPYYAAAKVQSTGEFGEQSDWIAAVPVPAAVWLFGSGLGLLGWMRRKSIVASQ